MLLHLMITGTTVKLDGRIQKSHEVTLIKTSFFHLGRFSQSVKSGVTMLKSVFVRWLQIIGRPHLLLLSELAQLHQLQLMNKFKKLM